MTASKHTPWARHLDAIGDELLRLAVACDVHLREPGVVERILNNDDSVCGRRNAIGFQKLHKLVLATFSSLGKAVDRIGPEETRMIVDEIRRRADSRMDLGGTAHRPGKGPGA